MPARVLTALAVEPNSLDDARSFLRVEHGDDDQVVAALIVGALPIRSSFPARIYYFTP
jgi:hypothetical protein